MNHYAWTYVAGGGRNTKVGLYHGSKSGHVLIYVGNKVVTIDFKVFESKDYTFFIDDELCKIKLERKGDKMYYFFEVDKKTDTPLNRARWARDRKHLWQMLLAFGGLVVLVVVFVFVAAYLKRPSMKTDEDLLFHQGVETIGRVQVRPSDSEAEITYQFVAMNQPVNASYGVDSQLVVILKNGMPLETGDEFVVRYVPSRPEVSSIYFRRPTERQLEVYQERAAEKFHEILPEGSPINARCVAKSVLAFEGIDGLADLYFSKASPNENPDHNQLTYQKLTQSLAFKKALSDCGGE